MTLATSREKLSEAITLAKARGPDPALRTALMGAADALDHGEWDEVIERLDDALTCLVLENRIADLTEASGLTREQVAAEVGVHARELQRWELGKEEIPAEYEHVLARLFGVREHFLVGEDRRRPR